MKNKDLERQFKIDAAKIQVPDVLNDIKNAEFDKYKDLPDNNLISKDLETVKSPNKRPKRYFKWASLIAVSLAVIVFSIIYIPGLFLKDPDEVSSNESWLNIGRNAESSYNVGVFVYNELDTYVNLMKNELLAQFTDSDSIYIQVYNAKGSQGLQNKQIDAKIKDGVDLLVVNIVDTNTAGETVINKAKNKNIPIVFFQRNIEESILNSYDKACFVSCDYYRMGRVQGELIFNTLLKDWDSINKCYKTFDKDGDKKISYALFVGQGGNIEADIRKKAVEIASELLKTAGMGELKGNSFEANWNTSEAYEQFMFNYSPENLPEIIVCGNDGMALGAIKALNEFGFNLSGNDEYYIPVFGIDGIDEVKLAIENKSMEGTITYRPEDIATAIAKIIINISNSKEFLYDTDYTFTNTSKTVYIDYVIIQKD